MSAIEITRPIVVTDAMLVSTNVPESDYPEWTAGSVNPVGARVIVSALHRVYESVQANNTGHPPATSPTWWIDVGPTNRWRAFDTKKSTQTLSPGGAEPKISYVFRPGRAINCVALIGVTGCNSARVKVTDPAYGLVYDEVVSFSSLPMSLGLYAWLFGQRREKTLHVLSDLPIFPGADVSVELSGSADLAVGVIVLGQVVRFGVGLQWGVSFDLSSYSRKVTDVNTGETDLKKGANSDRVRLPMLLDTQEVDAVRNFMRLIDGTACLFVGTSPYEVTTVYGFMQNFSELINLPSGVDAEVLVQSLI